VPKEKDLRAAYEKAGLEFPDELKAPLKACKSVLLIERPGNLDRDPVQVSLLGHVLEHTGEALISFDEVQFQLVEDVVLSLLQKKTAAGFGKKAVSGGPALDDVEIKLDRSIESVQQIMDTFEAAQHNLDLQIDLRRILGASSTLVKQYVTLLVNQGAVKDSVAAKALGVAEVQIKKAREEVEAVTRTIRPPHDESPAPIPGEPTRED